jgi:protein-S-isoprenylcysteine O-methyltransferase Ste14
MKKAADYLFVSIQILIFVFYFWQPKPLADFLPAVWKYVGWTCMITGGITLLVAVLQLNKHLSMLPTPTEKAKLRTGGIYSVLRHPIYAGIIYFAIGYALYKDDTTRLLIAIILILFFEFKTLYEERQLKIKFPEYEAYKNKTGKFFPIFSKKSVKNGTQNTGE